MILFFGTFAQSNFFFSFINISFSFNSKSLNLHGSNNTIKLDFFVETMSKSNPVLALELITSDLDGVKNVASLRFFGQYK